MKHTILVNQEDTTDTMEISPFIEGELIQNLSDVGWSCRQAVLTADGKNVVLSNNVTTKTLDDLYFSATLEPLDTAILNEDQYIWIIEITNNTIEPKYRRELQVILAVSKHHIWNLAETFTVYDIVAPDPDVNGDVIFGKQVRIATTTLPVGTILSIKLLDNDDNILQTAGYVSDTLDNSQVVITLTEPVKVEPTKLMVNI